MLTMIFGVNGAIETNMFLSSINANVNDNVRCEYTLSLKFITYKPTDIILY